MRKWILSALCIAIAAPTLPGQAADAAARRASWERHQEMAAASPFRDLEWRSAGPRFSGGRIESVAVPPGRPYTLYVGMGSGGVWKSVNNGVTWKPIFDDQPGFTIGEIAIAPTDPDIIWVGTGEVLMARSSYAGTGIYKSTDGGATWTDMGLNDTHHITRVLIHPENPDIVFAAAMGRMFSYNEERGLFKTVDGGRTWENILFVSKKTGVVDVEMDPENPDILYACAWERDRKAWAHIVSGEESAAYKSIDGGRNWKKMTAGLPQGENVGRIGIEVSATNPSVLYALLDNQALKTGAEQATGRRSNKIRGELYRSDDRGETWRKTHTGDLPTAIGYDFNLLRISPEDENEIYVGGNRFLHSTDGGRTFTQIGGTVVHLLYKEKREFSLDQHALWIDPERPDRVILGNDHGLYMSFDGTRSWLHVNNLPVSEFYAISVDMAEPYNIYGGTQDNAAVFGPSDSDQSDGRPDPWQNVYLDRWGGGDSYFTELDPTNPDVIYYEHQFGALRRKDMSTGETKNIMPRDTEGEAPLRRNWMTPFIISHYEPRTLYYGAQKIFKSPDRGDTWTALSPDLSTGAPDKLYTTPPYGGIGTSTIPYGTITTISESRLERELMYAGTDDGNVQVTRDGGATWTLIREGLPRKWVTRVTASLHEPGTVYASLTGYREDDISTYVYASRDYGAGWAPIGNGLPAEPVNVIREDPERPEILYIGTDLGVYVTLDRGGNWFSLSRSLPPIPIQDLVVHPRDGEIVIGTHGRGIYVLDVKPIRERSASGPPAEQPQEKIFFLDHSRNID